MKEEMKSTQTIEIPEGTFEGNCSDCVYADWNDTDRYGRVYCRGSYGGYNNSRRYVMCTSLDLILPIQGCLCSKRNFFCNR